MRKTILYSVVAFLVSSCGNQSGKSGVSELPQEQISVFSSTDSELEKTYNWARKMALSYAHDGADPVGYWYEAALPQREAFCMRDVSHQSVGAQILGLDKHNKNMFTKFAENISEGKDWCSYWEINRYNEPAPADYTNDKEFWYNLNANFDVLQACYKMYEWTGDEDYLKNPTFTNFYDKSLNEYVKHWMLEPENIMDRPRYMHQPENFDLNNNFHTCRGLASYVENFRGLTLGVDLLASIYAGYMAHANMAAICGDNATAENNKKKAKEYQEIIENKWWNEEKQYYQTFWTEDKTFHRGEGVPFLLWFNVTDNKTRINATVKDILANEWNVENLSAFPALLYRLGYNEEAYKYLVSLPTMNRSEYPEVSYGVIEGCVGGLMGIKPAAGNILSTCSHTNSDVDVKIENLPLWDGYVTVQHSGKKLTHLKNNTGRKLTWNISFIGEYFKIEVNGIELKPVISEDSKGNIISTAIFEIENNNEAEAKACI